MKAVGFKKFGDSKVITFSIKVASVIGNFKAVPKQAHWIWDFWNKALMTPKVVMDKIKMVKIVEIRIWNSSK